VSGDPDGTGTVTITGEGSTLTANVMSIGFSGEGTLNVLNDATATSEVTVVGVTPEGIGHVIVENAPGTWTNTGSVVVGAYGEGDLTVRNDGHVVVGETLYIGGYDPEDVDDGVVDQGYAPDGTGTVTVTGVGSLLEAEGIGVGIDGDGTLEILAGAEVQAEAAVVGLGADGVGTVLVDGQVGENRSTWRIESEVEDDIPIPEGEGEVIVSNGGQVIVDGDGILHVGDKITVGSEGDDSRMTISDGGFVSSAISDIGGYNPDFDDLADYFDPDTELNDGTGAVTVTGDGSRWDTDHLAVGFSGDGTLAIENGGYVWDLSAVVGMFEGVTGTVEVTGADSTWDNLGDLAIGAWGAGELTISAAGTVFATDAYIGGMPLSVIGAEDDPDHTPTGTGIVTVTGENSEFIVAAPSSLYVGYTGDGTLNVLEGGYVESVTAGIGALPGSTGDVTVDGVHSGEGDIPSEWHNDGSAFVGGYGTGSLTVSAGGEVHIGDTLYIGGYDPEQADFVSVEGSDPDGTGDVTVTGAGSLLTVGGIETLYVGYSSTGTLSVLAGGSVESAEATIGYAAGSVGEVTVSGPDSTWTASEQSIGGTGQGSLTISDTGTVTTNSAILGQMVGGSGEVLVTGADSGWQINNTLWVGYRGEGELTIAEGAQVESSIGVLGEEATATGTVWVTGESSRWSLPGELYIGYAGTGLVDVRDDAVLFVDSDLYVGGTGEGSGGTGVLNVSDGGEVIAQEMTIWETGTLTGDGTVSVLVPTTLDNYGTIAPGDDGIGTLTVNGNVVFHEDSTYAVQINNSDESDKLEVDGDVTIDGGTVQVASVGTILGEHEYEIISADLVAGEFADLDTGLLNFEFEELTYPDGTSVWLHVTAANFNDPDVARTYNQRQVAGALQEIAGPENPVTGAVQQLETIDEVRDSYDQLSGQTRPPLAPMTVAGSSKFLGTVTSRTQNVRTGLVAGAFDSSLTAAAGPDQAVGGSPAYATAVGGPTFAVGNGSSVLADRRWGIWGRGYGLFGDRDAEGNLSGYDYHVYGGSFGVDYQINESLLAGLVGGMSQGDVDFDRSRDNTDFDAAHIGLYASLAWDRWNVDSVFTYANLDYETRRYVDVLDERLSGDFDGYELAGYVEISRSYDLAPDLRLAPLASLQYTYLDLDSYTETGGDSALSFDDQTHESVRGSLGARLTKRLIESTGDFRADVQVRGRWVHEFGDERASVDTTFASDPTVVFTVKDEEISRDSAVLGAGLSAELNRQTRAYVDYDTRLNSDETVHVFSASLQYRW
jgi:outer membrane autotransporter protein